MLFIFILRGQVKKHWNSGSHVLYKARQLLPQKQHNTAPEVTFPGSSSDSSYIQQHYGCFHQWRTWLIAPAYRGSKGKCIPREACTSIPLYSTHQKSQNNNKKLFNLHIWGVKTNTKKAPCMFSNLQISERITPEHWLFQSTHPPPRPISDPMPS